MRRLLPLLGLASLLGLAGSPAFSAPPPAPGETGDVLQARDPGETGKGGTRHILALDPGETGHSGLQLAETGEAGTFALTAALDPGETGEAVQAALPGCLQKAKKSAPGEAGSMLSSMDPGETGDYKVVAQADPGEGGPLSAPLR